MTAFCWAIAGHYQVTQGLTLPPYLRFGCYQRECIKCALVRLPEVAGGLPFTLGKNFNSFKQLTQCNTQLSAPTVQDTKSTARLIRLAFPQIVVLSFPAHVCNQGGVKCRPECCQRINPASFGFAAPSIWLDQIQCRAEFRCPKTNHDIPSDRTIKAIHKETNFARQRSALK